MELWQIAALLKDEDGDLSAPREKSMAERRAEARRLGLPEPEWGPPVDPGDTGLNPMVTELFNAPHESQVVLKRG
jgi:hypothetical protein